MFNVRFINDIHNEVNLYDVPAHPSDKDTVLSLAGDIYDRKRLMPWIAELAPRFKHVILVLGNHDYWNGSYELVVNTHKKYIKDHNLTNVHYLDNSHVVIDGIIVFGGTLWTNYNNQDPLTRLSTKEMNDYHKIRTDNYQRRFGVSYATTQHMNFLWNLKCALEDESLRGMPMFVVSHHAPCRLSLDDRYLDRHILNGFYYTELSEFILDHPTIIAWHHGHVHSKKDYMLGDTRVICEPRGYVEYEEMPDFDPFKMIDLHQLEAFKSISLCDK